MTIFRSAVNLRSSIPDTDPRVGRLGLPRQWRNEHVLRLDARLFRSRLGVGALVVLLVGRV